jgi:putative ABC transport system permease protein
VSDFRYAVRSILKTPGFTAVAVLTVAIGIGATTSIFTVVRAVLLKPLPYPEPDRLTTIWMSNPRENIDKDVTSWPMFSDWRTGARSFEGMAGYTRTRATLLGDGEPLELQGAWVSEDFFRTFGVQPAAGRTFGSGDLSPSRPNVVVIAHGLWTRRFGADPRAIGRTLTLGTSGYEVVGVMPASFAFPDGADFWRPFDPAGPMKDLLSSRGSLWLSVVGRLRGGVSLSSAQAEMDVIGKGIAEANPQSAGTGVLLEPLHQQIVGDVRPAMLILFAAVGVLLLIACANIANLLLARGATRSQELAVRAALGAGRLRIVRTLLSEGLVIGIAGGILGVLTAFWTLDLLLALAPDDVPRLDQVRLDSGVLAFAIALSLLTGLLFATAPAIEYSNPDLTSGLRESSRTGHDTASSHRMRSLLVIVEVALAMVLLVAAGLMLRSFAHVSALDPGFHPDRVLAVPLRVSGTSYPNPESVRGFYGSLVDRVAALPGVQSVGGITSLFLSRLPNQATLRVEGRTIPPPGTVEVPVPYSIVLPGYFETMETPLRRGRFFDDRDRQGAINVVIVNEALVRRFFSDEDPIGRRITYGNPAAPNVNWLTIVGVVADARRSGLDEPVREEVFAPHAQRTDPAMVMVVRAAVGDATTLAASVRAAVRELDRELPVPAMTTVGQGLADTLGPRRFAMILLSVFAGLAFALSVVGLYGLMSYSVARRRQEFGIRTALGASRATVMRLVLGQALLLVAAGVAAGLFGAWLTTRVLGTLLVGVGATDPVTYIGMVLALLLSALAASAIPAAQATRVDPVVALRGE